MADINWEQVRKEGRARIIYLRPDAVLAYCAVQHGREYMMNIMDTYELPKQWTLSSVHHAFDRRAFACVILSPAFDPVPVGREIPTLVANRCQVKITREVIA